ADRGSDCRGSRRRGARLGVLGRAGSHDDARRLRGRCRRWRARRAAGAQRGPGVLVRAGGRRDRRVARGCAAGSHRRALDVSAAPPAAAGRPGELDRRRAAGWRQRPGGGVAGGRGDRPGRCAARSRRGLGDRRAARRRRDAARSREAGAGAAVSGVCDRRGSGAPDPCRRSQGRQGAARAARRPPCGQGAYRHRLRHRRRQRLDRRRRPRGHQRACCVRRRGGERAGAGLRRGARGDTRVLRPVKRHRAAACPVAQRDAAPADSAAPEGEHGRRHHRLSALQAPDRGRPHRRHLDGVQGSARLHHPRVPARPLRAPRDRVQGLCAARQLRRSDRRSARTGACDDLHRMAGARGRLCGSQPVRSVRAAPRGHQARADRQLPTVGHGSRGPL
ncbi:MAG: hypothetical protein AVDCRST_MAG67-3550, partial [uncultured Solirubrobacteraceae bacterium]